MAIECTDSQNWRAPNSAFECPSIQYPLPPPYTLHFEAMAILKVWEVTKVVQQDTSTMMPSSHHRHLHCSATKGWIRSLDMLDVIEIPNQSSHSDPWYASLYQSYWSLWKWSPRARCNHDHRSISCKHDSCGTWKHCPKVTGFPQKDGQQRRNFQLATIDPHIVSHKTTSCHLSKVSVVTAWPTGPYWGFCASHNPHLSLLYSAKPHAPSACTLCAMLQQSMSRCFFG